MKTSQLLAPIVGLGLLIGCSADTTVGSEQDTAAPDTVADVAQDASADASEEDTAVDIQVVTEAIKDTQSDAAGDAGCSSDEQCDDGNPCNGLETCNALSGDCTPGTPRTSMMAFPARKIVAIRASVSFMLRITSSAVQKEHAFRESAIRNKDVRWPR